MQSTHTTKTSCSIRLRVLGNLGSRLTSNRHSFNGKPNTHKEKLDDFYFSICPARKLFAAKFHEGVAVFAQVPCSAQKRTFWRLPVCFGYLNPDYLWAFAAEGVWKVLREYCPNVDYVLVLPVLALIHWCRQHNLGLVQANQCDWFYASYCWWAPIASDKSNEL